MEDPQQFSRNQRRDDKDPSQNVMMLVELTVKGLKEFVIAQVERLDEKYSNHQKHDREMAEEKNRRISSDIQHCIDMMAEGFKNVDKNREGDIGNVAVASEKSAEVADTLAKQVTGTSDTMNTRMVASAEALARNLDTRMEQVNTKIDQFVTLVSGKVSNLELAQGENKGKTGMTTPLLMGICTVIGGIIVAMVGILAKVAYEAFSKG